MLFDIEIESHLLVQDDLEFTVAHVGLDLAVILLTLGTIILCFSSLFCHLWQNLRADSSPDICALSCKVLSPITEDSHAGQAISSQGTLVGTQEVTVKVLVPVSGEP